MNCQRGFITPALLIIAGSFVIVIYALLLILGLQLSFSNRQVAQEQAINIAEAGINYYRWHLAHAPEDFQDGTGEEGPYEHEYFDPQGSKMGNFSLEITAPENGSSIVTIKSTAWTKEYPNIKRSVVSQYGKPSLTKYSFLQNASSWYGTNITVHGLVHSNNGIRMDGINTSLVTSAQETYLCGSETGCNPSRTKPGVWGSGSGGNQGLWQFPVPAVDFDAISFDFRQMRDSAKNEGLYLKPSKKWGYHLIFNQNGTVQVKKVTRTRYYWGYSSDDDCQRRYERIRSETTVGTYNVSEKPIIFAEDDLWIEGSVNGKVSVVAARFPIDSYKKNIWICNNLVYADYDHSNSIGVIAQNDIYFCKDIPNDFKVDGALLAQHGKIIRHGYFWWCGGSSGALKNKLTINGSIISYYKSYWNFYDPPQSGFRERVITYDTDLLYAPPPYFPTSGEYEFISWREE